MFGLHDVPLRISTARNACFEYGMAAAQWNNVLPLASHTDTSRSGWSKRTFIKSKLPATVMLDNSNSIQLSQYGKAVILKGQSGFNCWGQSRLDVREHSFSKKDRK